MSDHRIVEILNTLKTIVEANTLGQAVQINQLDPFGEGENGFNIVLGEDTPVGGSGPQTTQYVDSEADIFIDCYATASATEWWLTVIDMRKEVHQLLMADHTLGLSYVLDVRVLGAEEPAARKESAQVLTRLRTLWQIQYRTSITDPSN